MGLDNIVKKLKAENEAEIDKLKQEAQYREAKLRSAHQAKLKAKKQEILNNFKAQLKREVDMKLWQIKSNLRQELLLKKKQVVDNIFTKVLEELKNLPEAKYEKLTTRLMLEIRDKSGEVLPAQGKEHIIKKALKNSQAKSKISNNVITAAGGFVWRSDDVNIDYTWESLVNNLREQTELEITKVLFN